MLKLQMVKIEELTLYTIEQQKEIDALRSSLLEIKQELQKLSKADQSATIRFPF